MGRSTLCSQVFNKSVKLVQVATLFQQFFKEKKIFWRSFHILGVYFKAILLGNYEMLKMKAHP